MALQGYFPAVTAHADTARPGDAAAYEIEVGETVALPSPDGRTTFESGDPRVATVTEGGVVTGVGEGRATIRATIAMSGIGGRLWEWALIIIGRMLGEHDPMAQTVTREFRVVVRPKADGRTATGTGWPTWTRQRDAGRTRTRGTRTSTGSATSAMGLWKGPWPSPRSLAYNIRQREGYEVGSLMHSEWPS